MHVIDDVDALPAAQHMWRGTFIRNPAVASVCVLNNVRLTIQVECTGPCIPAMQHTAKCRALEATHRCVS